MFGFEYRFIILRNCYMVYDDAFFQPDWAEACWGRWAGPGLMWTGRKALDRRAGDRTAAGLVCRLWM